MTIDIENILEEVVVNILLNKETVRQYETIQLRRNVVVLKYIYL